MKNLFIFAAIIFVSTASARTNRVYNEANALINKTRLQWNSEVQRTKVEARTVINAIDEEIKSLNSSVVSAVRTLKNQTEFAKVNQTLNYRIEQMKNQLTSIDFDQIFGAVDDMMQIFLNDIMREITAAESTSQLATCWDRNKSKLETTVESFVRELHDLIFVSIKSASASSTKFASENSESRRKFLLEVKNCQAYSDPTTCSTNFVSF